MAARRRTRLASRRRTRGFSQESLAAELNADRSTVARWERGQCDPQPYHLPKLCELLHVSLDELDDLLTPESPERQTASTLAPVEDVVVMPTGSSDELEDLSRRELLCLLSIAGTLVAAPERADARTYDAEQIGRHELLNSHLWQVFTLAECKRTVYPVVRQQLDLLIGDLHRTRSSAAHRRLCGLTGDLFQLAGEIFFDADRYTDAAHCYKLAADASKEGGTFDLWACALIRYAYLHMYERRFDEAVIILEGAARVARRGDGRLSTRHWVAAVQAEAYAGLGDLDACHRALGAAEEVQTLTGPIMPGGWLRFDGARLAEERGRCYSVLGQTDVATDVLTRALDTATSLRRRAGVLTDLARLGVQARDLDQVLHYGGQAADLAERTRSSGCLGRKLHDLRGELVPLRSDLRAAQLSDRIARL